MVHKDYRSVKTKISKAFRVLFTKNIVAFPNFSCCQNCGTAEISAMTDFDQFRGYAFYHDQDNESMKVHGDCYIAFGDTKNADRSTNESVIAIGDEIVYELEDAGLTVEWDRRPTTRIKVSK